MIMKAKQANYLLITMCNLLQMLFPASQSHTNSAFLLAAAARSSGWSISATMLPETVEETQVLTYESKLGMYIGLLKTAGFNKSQIS